MDRTMVLVRHAAVTAACIGAVRSSEIMIKPPPHEGIPLTLVELVVTGKFWLAAAALGVIALVWRALRLLVGPPQPPAVKEKPAALTGEDRHRAIGFNIVAAWVVLSFLALVIMGDTGTGPFAWFAREVLGLDAAATFVAFLLGMPAFILPLVLAAILPRQDRWPIIAAVQDSVRPPPRRTPKRRASSKPASEDGR